MAILLPLSLIGIGALVYYMFAGATMALPILVGLAAGLAGNAAGYTGPGLILIGTTAFLLTIALGHFTALTLRSRLARLALLLLFALPAAVAGFFLSTAIASFTGLTSLAAPLALVGALLTGGVAVHRLVQTSS